MTLWWWWWWCRESNRPYMGARFSDDTSALRNLHCHYFEILYIEVLFQIFYNYWGKENCSLYRGLRYVEVRYIEVPLYIKTIVWYYSTRKHVRFLGNSASNYTILLY